MATPLKPIECSAQPLSISFHPVKDVVAAGLVDGTVEIHDLVAKCSRSDTKTKAKANKLEEKQDDMMEMESDNDEDDELDTIISSIHVAKEMPPPKMSSSTKPSTGAEEMEVTSSKSCKATQGPSCRNVLFSRSPHDRNSENERNIQSGGEHLFTACNNGSLRCLDSELACSLDHFQDPDAASPILWSVEDAHSAGISALYQLPHSSPCGPALASGDDAGTVRLWDTRICGGRNNNEKSNPFDNLMKLPTGCIQHWKVNHDYVTDFEANEDGTTLFASSADGTLSVFDIRFVNRKGTPRSVSVPNVDPRTLTSQQQRSSKSWKTAGYTQSDNQDDEILSLSLVKKSQKLLCGTQTGTLLLFSYNFWGDTSDRFPGHPQSLDALLKIDEDTVLTGSSDGLVRAVQLLPNTLLGVLGGHDGFPVEGLGFSAGRKMVGSLSHDEYIRLWDGSFLNEDSDNDDDDEEKEDNKQENEPCSQPGLTGMSGTKGQGSDDDWDDIEEDKDDDMDSDDDDSNNGATGGKPKKREKMFKTENEAFFSDL